MGCGYFREGTGKSEEIFTELPHGYTCHLKKSSKQPILRDERGVSIIFGKDPSTCLIECTKAIPDPPKTPDDK